MNYTKTKRRNYAVTETARVRSFHTVQLSCLVYIDTRLEALILGQLESAR